MIHLDTSLLVDALTGRRRSAGDLRAAIERGERMGLSALVLYEWRRGPRIAEEVEAQEALFPSTTVAAFGPEQAEVAAKLNAAVRRPRGREIDLAIAATAITNGAALWTLNEDDFEGIPDLELFSPPKS